MIKNRPAQLEGRTMDSDSDFGDGAARVRVVSRLAALQRLRDQAMANERNAMLESINRMIDAELRALHARRDRDPEPQA